MRNGMLVAVVLSVAALALGATTTKHGGRLNACGCHVEHASGECHCHRDTGCECACHPPRCDR